MAERQLPKLNTGVRFPSPAPHKDRPGPATFWRGWHQHCFPENLWNLRSTARTDRHLDSMTSIPSGVSMRELLTATFRFCLLIVLGVLPFLVVAGFLGWRDVIKVSVYGFFVALLATVLDGPRIGTEFAFVFSLFAALGAISQQSTVATAAVVGLSAALIPYYAIRGYLAAGVFAAMFLANTINQPPRPWFGTDSLSISFFAAVALVTLISGMWGLAIGRLVKARLPALPAGKKITKQIVLPVGALGVVVTVAIAYFCVTHFPNAKWASLLTAIYSMLMAAGGMTLRASWALIAGTTIGSLFAVAILFTGLSVSLMVLVGAIVLSASIAMRVAGEPTWLATSVNTTGVIFLTGSTMNPYVAAEDRVLFTTTGASIAVLLGSAITGVIHWRSQAVADPTTTKPA